MRAWTFAALGILVAVSAMACSESSATSDAVEPGGAGGGGPGKTATGGDGGGAGQAPPCTSSGAPQEIARFDAVGYPRPTSVALAPDAIFVATEDNVWRLPREGGAPEVVAGDQPANVRGGAALLAVHEGTLYRGGYRSAFMEKHATSAAGTWAATRIAIRKDKPDFAFAGERVFSVTSTPTPVPGTSWLFSADLDGNAVETLLEQSGDGAIGAFAAAETEVFATVNGDFVRLAGGSKKVLGRATSTVFGQDAEAIYLRAQPDEAGVTAVLRMARDGASPVHLADVPFVATLLARDGVVWAVTSAAETTAGFVRIDATSGRTEELGSLQGVLHHALGTPLAADGASLYFAVATPEDQIRVVRVCAPR